MHSPYSRIPLVPVAIGFMAGILLFCVGTPWYWIAAVALCAVGLLYRPERFYTFGVLAAGAGWIFAAAYAPARLPDSLHGNKTELSATVIRIEPSGDYHRLLVAADSLGGVGLDTPLRMWLTLMDDPGFTGIGSRIRAEGYIRAADRFDGLPFETDYAAFAAVDQVSATMTVGGDDYRVLTPGHGFGEQLRRYRRHLTDAIYLSGLDERTADFAVATVCGDDSNLSAEAREMFRTLGLAHLLALSGFHVALFAGLVTLLLYPLRLWRRFRCWRYVAVLAAVWAYVTLTGLSASSVRAAIMMTIMTGGILLQRPGASYNTLAAAALLMLAWNPYLLFSPGFQLSFTAVLGLLSFAEKFNPFCRRRHWPHLLAAILAVPLAAVTGTVLVSASYFHSFPLLFLPANAVVTLIASLFIGGCSVLAILAGAGIGCGALVWVLNGLYSLTDGFCNQMMRIPLKEISGLYPATPTILLLGMAIVLFAVALHRRQRTALILSAACVALSVGSQAVMAEQEPVGELYIPSHSADTRILLRHGRDVALYSDAPAAAAPAIRSDCNRRYSRWLQMRGCNAEFALLDSVARTGGLRRNHQLVQAGPYSLWIVESADDIIPAGIDYVVIGRNCRMNFAELAADVRPRAVILTSQLSLKRRRRYLRECRHVGLNVHNAADSTFSLVW